MQINGTVAAIGLSVGLLFAPFGAARADAGGPYLGVGWGAYRINEGAFDEHDDLLKAYVGIPLVKWLAVEGSWVDFNRLDNPSGDKFDADGAGLAAVLSLPVSGTSAIYAKGGEFWWKANSVLAGQIGDKNGSDPFYGTGLKLGFTRNLAVRLEWERYEVSNIDLDTATVSLQFQC